MTRKRSSSQIEKENEVQGDTKKLCLRPRTRQAAKRPPLKQLSVAEEGGSPVKRQRDQEILTPCSSNDSYHSAISEGQWKDLEKAEYYDFEECGDFQKLPDHILSEILGYLTRDEKLKMTTTCKRFERIFCEPANMKHFVLTLNFDTNEMPELKRQYQVVTVTNLALPGSTKREQSIKRVFKSMGSHFKKVEFFHCSLTERFLTNALKFCLDIKDLSFVECEIEKSLTKVTFPRFPQLKIFVSDVKSMEIASSLLRRVETLEDFSIRKRCSRDINSYSHISSDDKLSLYNRIKTILASQKQLKSLELCDGDFFDSEFADINFQLEKLILYQPVLRHDQPNHMSQFLRTQKNISKMILNTRLNHVSPSFHSALLYIMELPTMRDLKIVFYSLMGMDTMFLESTIVNPNIVDLYVSLRPFAHEFRRMIEKVTTTFPNVKKLHIKLDREWLNPFNTTELTFKPLNSLTKLETLVIEGASTRIITMLKLPNLKRLLLPDLQNIFPDDWELFLKNNRQLEEIAAFFPEGDENVDGSSLPHVVQFFEQSIRWLQQGITIRACVNGVGVPNSTLSHLMKFAILNKGPHLTSLHLCSIRLNF